jgi:hypothetical protein
MPLKTMSDDRKVLLVAAAVLVLLLVVVAIFAPSEQQEIGYPSSYSSESKGAKAAYLLLSEGGYNVARWLRPPQELPQGPGTVLILAESWTAEKEEKEALQKFLAQGGRVVAVGLRAAMLLPENDAAYGADVRDCPT